MVSSAIRPLLGRANRSTSRSASFDGLGTDEGTKRKLGICFHNQDLALFQQVRQHTK
jgi:hypothetical protein